MLDTIFGLPVHALVVHGVVVLLPLMAVVTVLVAFVPRLHWARWWVVAGNVGVTAMAFVARQSGEELQARLGGQVAIEHGRIGYTLWYFGLGLVVASVLVAVAKTPTQSRAFAVLSIVAAAGATLWTIRTGHSGSEAVWGEIVKNTKAP